MSKACLAHLTYLYSFRSEFIFVHHTVVILIESRQASRESAYDYRKNNYVLVNIDRHFSQGYLWIYLTINYLLYQSI